MLGHNHCVHDLTASILDLVLGRVCAGCDEPGCLLCDRCAALLEPQPRLRRQLNFDDIMHGLRIPLVCALDYRGPIRSILYQYKDHRIRQLAGEIAPALAAAVSYAADHAHISTNSIVLVPMPTRKGNIRRRGFDATAHLTSHVQRIIPTRGVAQLLSDQRMSRGVKHQGVFEREQAIRDAFSLKRRRRSANESPVILVDDIVTTGSTVREAALALILAGVQVAAIATAAGTP